MKGKTCVKCKGTGWYDVRRGNPNGLCYACKGKGIQSEGDRRRNWGYIQYRELQAEVALNEVRAERAAMEQETAA